ncbi:MAG TPA: histidine phosphatase family protein [Planctomycetota bacterium]|nr:histidine phosphatase family protein [Planctomycetota bacterium]
MPSARVRILLVRHGESVLGRARRYAGHRDTPLTAAGRRQIRRLRARFRRFRADVLFTSDLRRCRQTAALLAPGRDVHATPRLRELDFGAWDGLTAEGCRRRDPARFARWMRNPGSTRPPGGESLGELRRRVRAFARSAVRRHAGKTLAFVTHAGPIRALASDDFWALTIKPGGMIEMTWRIRRP